jgi:G:T/U-mismatch repair DNA glycosylase
MGTSFDHHDHSTSVARQREFPASLASAYQGVFRERSERGPQERRLGETALFVLPSTSPANAAIPWSERLRWFQSLRELVR